MIFYESFAFDTAHGIMQTQETAEEEIMSIARVRAYFEQFGMAGRIIEPPVSSATVALAAEALHVEPARIAKTLSLHEEDGCMLLVTAGDARIDNRKFRDRFHRKARMLSHEEAERMTGHAVGGVCPFALPEGVPVYLDVSLQRFAAVFPATGSANSAIELTNAELFQYARAADWVDVCTAWGGGGDPVIDETLQDLPDSTDGTVTLRLREKCPANPQKGYVPAYKFDILDANGACAGDCDLRLGYRRGLYYGGHIGYTVLEAYRGHGYAGHACRLLFDVARLHRMPYLYINCRRGNLPSQRTLEKLGGTLVEITAVPPDNEMYENGLREECVFRFDLGDAEG